MEIAEASDTVRNLTPDEKWGLLFCCKLFFGNPDESF